MEVPQQSKQGDVQMGEQMKNQRNKTIFKLVAAMVAIVLVVFNSVSCSKGYKEAIETVLAKDKAISESFEDPQSVAEAKKILASTVAQMQRINLDDCPEDFRVAYQKHINAWQQAYVAFQKIPDSKWDWPFWKLFTGYDLEEEEKLIQSTWFEVKNVAIKYKVSVQDKLQ